MNEYITTTNYDGNVYKTKMTMMMMTMLLKLLSMIMILLLLIITLILIKNGIHMMITMMIITMATVITTRAILK